MNTLTREHVKYYKGYTFSVNVHFNKFKQAIFTVKVNSGDNKYFYDQKSLIDYLTKAQIIVDNKGKKISSVKKLESYKYSFKRK
jgi:hypothetical protein